MRVVFVAELSPRQSHTVNAAPIVLFQIVSAIADLGNLTVAFRQIGNTPITADEEEALASFKARGIEILPPAPLPPKEFPRRFLRRMLAPRDEDFVPELQARNVVAETVEMFQADAVVTVWSEVLTALFASAACRKVAYYGNPNDKNLLAQSRILWKNHEWKSWLAARLLLPQLERMHRRIALSYQVFADVAANDAEYYRAIGHRDAPYIRNVWLDRLGDTWRARREELESPDQVRIVGNVGKLRATANTLGMEILGREILPELKRRMEGRPYVVDIIGSGQLHSFLVPLLDRPEVRIRGFVDDIDAEMLGAQIFMCANNASSYNVGHTRYLHAWSLGCCVVAHRNASLAMPEIRHGENALLGDTPAEMARLAAEAAADPTLRRKLGEAGYQTFKTLFTAQGVAADLTSAVTRATASPAGT